MDDSYWGAPVTSGQVALAPGWAYPLGPRGADVLWGQSLHMLTGPLNNVLPRRTVPWATHSHPEPGGYADAQECGL